MEKFKILSEKENPLFNRKEIRVVVESPKNPTYVEGMKLIADKFKTDVKNVKVKSIKGKFGSDEFSIEVNIYDSEEHKKEFEKLSKKDEIPEEKPVEEAPATEQPVEAEAPKEEKTEEVKEVQE